MKLVLAVQVAKQCLDNHPGNTLDKSSSIIYRAKNGQYMTAKDGSPAALGLPQWSIADFYQQHKNKVSV